jgi:hypothetical protein
MYGTSPEHRESVMQAIAWLKGQDEPILRVDQYERDPETGKVLWQYGRPDLSTPYFIVECKLDEAAIKERLKQRLARGSVSDGRWEILGPTRGWHSIRKTSPAQKRPSEQLLVISIQWRM